jgi:two-component system cell cycle response regulator DivK
VKILLVEDFDDTRALLKLMVSLKGYTPLEATNGLEAVDLAIQEQPDLILMDLSMPLLDGWEATRRITANKKTQHIPVIAISAQCEDEWREKALAAGAKECISKPIDNDIFDAVLERFSLS